MFYILGLVGVLVMLVVQYLTRKTTNSFLTRLVSGVILVLIALMGINAGGWVLFLISLALALIGTFELYRALGIHRGGRTIDMLELFGYISVILYYVSLVYMWGSYQVFAIICSLVIVMFVYVFSYPKYNARQIMETYFGVIYVGVMLSFVYQTRCLEGGQFIVWLIFLCSWGCDTCAYCAGRLFGKHKMAPVLSPKKTIEGAIGGVAGATILGMIYALLTQGPVMEYMIICLIGALISMIGDLSASAIKRNADIKDYGKLIPGHGGVLDRFDSVIFTAPIIYFLAVTLVK